MALAFVLIRCASSTHIYLLYFIYLLTHKESKMAQVFFTRYIFPILQTILMPNIQGLPLQKSAELLSLV